MSLSLVSKPAVLGDKFNGHNIRPHAEGGEDGGDAGDPVPARAWKFTEIPLTKNQFEGLIGQAAFARFFNAVPGKALERADSSYSKLPLDNEYTNCAVKIVFGNTHQREIEIENGARIKNLTVKFPKQGMNERACALLSLTVEAPIPMNVSVLQLENFNGKEVKLSLRFGPVEEQTDEDDKTVDLVEKARQEEEEERERAGGSNGEARAH